MATDICGICSLEADILLLQSCFRCDTTYHLNPSSKDPGIDCGDALIGPELGVYYYCNPCLTAINDEEIALTAQQAQLQMQASSIQRTPGWTMPGLAAPGAPEPAAPPPVRASTPPQPRTAGATPRRRFRRIDQ